MKKIFSLSAILITLFTYAEEKREYYKWPKKGETHTYKQTPGYVSLRGEVRNQLEIFIHKIINNLKLKFPLL